MQNYRRILSSAQNCLLHTVLMSFIFKGLFWMPPQQPCTTCKTPSLTSVWVSQLGGSIMIPAVTDTGMSGRLSYAAPCLHADNAQPWHYLQYTTMQHLPVPHTLHDTQLTQLLNIHEILSSICVCTPTTNIIQFSSVIQHDTLLNLALTPALSFPTQYCQFSAWHHTTDWSTDAKFHHNHKAAEFNPHLHNPSLNFQRNLCTKHKISL